MAHPLDGSRLKLVRAEKHLNDIIEVLRRLEHGECELIPEKQENSDFGVLRIRLTPKPPDDLSVIAGDCLFNLRSALDHIIWQLVLINKKTPARRHIFPICKTAEAFKEAITAHRRLDDVPTQAATLIDGLQPYHTRDTHPLALLSQLHNIDKHQQLNLITAVASDTELAWNRTTIDGMAETVLTSILGNEELRDGALMPFGLRLDHPDYPGLRERFEKMKVQGQATLFVAFADRFLDPRMAAIEDAHALETMLEHLRVDWILQEILEFLREKVFPTFEPFFN